MWQWKWKIFQPSIGICNLKQTTNTNLDNFTGEVVQAKKIPPSGLPGCYGVKQTTNFRTCAMMNEVTTVAVCWCFCFSEIWNCICDVLVLREEKKRFMITLKIGYTIFSIHRRNKGDKIIVSDWMFEVFFLK